MMIHFSCDRCKQMLDPEVDMRYVVNLEVYAAVEPTGADSLDDDRDHLVEIQEMLEDLDHADLENLGQETHQKQRYDLCAECYKEFIKNPVGREISTHLNFSQN